MTRFEWISVLRKAKERSEGKDETCHKMFGYLLDAVKELPVLYPHDEKTEEEDEDEDD